MVEYINEQTFMDFAHLSLLGNYEYGVIRRSLRGFLATI